MEQIEFNYPAAKRGITKRAHVGVVGSGDMEVLMEPTQSEGAHVSITTSVDGFQSTWKAVFDRFFSRFDGAVRVQINDAGVKALSSLTGVSGPRACSMREPGRNWLVPLTGWNLPGCLCKVSLHSLTMVA